MGSGAEVRDPQRRVVKTTSISMELCGEIYEAVRKYPISVTFCTDGDDYRIGTEEEVEESIVRQIQMFHLNLCRDELKDTEIYQRMKRTTRNVAGLDELEKAGVPVYKIFLFSADVEMLDQIRRELEQNSGIAVASSFETNLEITDVKAQKGPVLKEYIESLGYTMDEVMALGDSLNDYSMLSMDFGATVAMANAVPEIRRAAKYITKSNVEFGVAYAIHELLKHQGKGNGV